MVVAAAEARHAVELLRAVAPKLTAALRIAQHTTVQQPVGMLTR